MNDTTIEPLSDGSLAYTKRVLERPDDEIADAGPALLRRLLATIDARDKTIAERDAEIARLRERLDEIHTSADAARESFRNAPMAYDALTAIVDAASPVRPH